MGSHSRRFLSNPTVATSNDHDLPRLIRDIICSPGWLRGEEFAKDPNALFGHDSESKSFLRSLVNDDSGAVHEEKVTVSGKVRQPFLCDNGL